MEVALSKVCNFCQIDKPTAEYFKTKDRKSGLASRCKACCSKWQRQRRVKFPKERRDIEMRSKYGISVDQYERMNSAQAEVCAVCGNKCSLHGKLSIDHDHDSGKVRGLLCFLCNSALGKFKDNPNVLASAIIYLHQHGKSLTCDAPPPA